MPKKKSKPLRPQPSTGTENICFTIMPFGAWFDDYYESIYTPAIEASGLVARRADDLYRPSAIVHDIWALTQSAKVLLADLSGKNPNVFYELGLAHAIARPAILVTESIDDVPFDLRALRVIVYNKNEPNWGILLKQSIESSIKEVLAAPLEAVLPTFLKIRETQKASVTPVEKELIAMRQDMDLLKRELQTQREPSVDRRISSVEARERIEEFLKRGAPIGYIIDRVSAAGAPRAWVRDQVVRYRRALENQQPVQPEEDTKPAVEPHAA